jgi:hypothetical protein
VTKYLIRSVLNQKPNVRFECGDKISARLQLGFEFLDFVAHVGIMDNLPIEGKLRCDGRAGFDFVSFPFGTKTNLLP